MKVLLDACVLYPTVVRETLLAVAERGVFLPLWSDRVLEEWARATRKLGPQAELLARGEIASLQAAWPSASVTWPESLEDRLWLPDPADVHVLAAAIAGSADVIVTVNAKDFPRNILAEEGLSRAAPDEFLLGCLEGSPDAVTEACAMVLQTAQHLSGEEWTARKLFKKARLPRLGKALELKRL